MIFEDHNFYKIQNCNPLILDLGKSYKIVGSVYKNQFESNPFFTFGGISKINNYNDLIKSTNQLKDFLIVHKINSLKINFPPSSYRFINLIQIDYLRTIFKKFKISKINYYFTIPNNPTISKSKLKFLKKKQNDYNISINDIEDLKKSYFIIYDNLSIKYNIKPVHNLKIFLNLVHYFKNSIDWFVYKNNDEYYAILIFFKYGNIAHCQYSCSIKNLDKIFPLDNLIAVAINKYSKENLSLSFGRVNDNSINLINYDLAEFKRRWGGLADPALIVEYNTLK